jgi:hypothetical protein
MVCVVTVLTSGLPKLGCEALFCSCLAGMGVKCKE